MTKVKPINLLVLVGASLLGVILIACDSQKHFKPELSYGKVYYNSSLEQKALTSTRDAIYLKDNEVKSKDNKSFILEPKEELLYNDDKRVVISKGCSSISVYSYESKKILRDKNAGEIDIKTPTCGLAASLKGNLLALMLGDNSYFIYDLDKKDYVFKAQGGVIYAVSSLYANPLFYKDSVIFPTLDGKLVFVDIKNYVEKKSIIVGFEKYLNNIIYLKAVNNIIVASTLKRVVTLLGDRTYESNIDLRDIYFDGSFIYALSVDGVINKLDGTLKVLRKVKLPYALLGGMVLKDDMLYVIEKNGYLLVIDINSFNYRALKLKVSRDSNIFYTKDSIITDEKILDFSKDIEIKVNSTFKDLYGVKPAKLSDFIKFKDN